MNLRGKFSLLISCLILLVVIGSGALHIFSERQLLVKESADRREAMIKQLAKVCQESLYQDDILLVNYFKTLTNEPAFVSAFFVDTQGYVRNSTAIDQIGKKFQLVTSKNLLVLSDTVVFPNREEGQAYIFGDAIKIKKDLDASLGQGIQRISIIVLVSLFIGLAGSFLLANSMVKPIGRIVEAMRHMSKGKLEPIRKFERSDELGWMAHELNTTMHKLKELDEMKKDFVDGITHELRSPLVAIDSFSHMVLNESDSKLTLETRNFMTTIQNNAKRLMTLVDNLLQTARLESEREDFERTQFDLGELVRSVAHLYQPLSQEKNLNFRVSIPKTPCFVWGDRDKTTQVVTNLISNAFKFTVKGSVQIRVFNQDEKGWVQVVDTGSGIPSLDQAHVFDKFFRSRANRKAAKGTGLGLTIAKGIVEGQGGKIRVESNPNGGAIFSFSVPA